MSDIHDLDSAVREASAAVESGQNGKALSRRSRSRTEIGNVPALLMIAVSTLLVSALIWESNYHQSQAELDADLQNIIMAAQTSVEEAKKVTGELPAAIPNVALAGVVTYQPSGSEYRLVLQINNRIARIEPDGSLHIAGVNSL